VRTEKNMQAVDSWCAWRTLQTWLYLNAMILRHIRASLGKHSVRWFDAPHLPHPWECGCLIEELSSTLLCGDLFTQGGADLPPITEPDIPGPSEIFRKKMDYFSPAKNARAMLERLALINPTTLACMHGSAWRGDGAKLLRALANELSA
jgi:hypothetical protein